MSANCLKISGETFSCGDQQVAPRKTEDAYLYFRDEPSSSTVSVWLTRSSVITLAHVLAEPTMNARRMQEMNTEYR
jgi:hypothetical protein